MEDIRIADLREPQRDAAEQQIYEMALGMEVDLDPAALVAAAEAVPRPAGVELLVTGVPFVRTDVVARMNADQMRFFPLVAVIFAGTIAVLFRRVRLGLAPLIAVVVADLLAWATG